jgi:protein-disulfide isomerase
MLVHEFALAAAAQGKFWSVESLLLADPKPMDREELKIVASQAGIDQNRLWAEVDAHRYASLISNDLMQARRIGVSGTPTFVVGDKKLDGVDGLAAVP